MQPLTILQRNSVETRGELTVHAEGCPVEMRPTPGQRFSNGRTLGKIVFAGRGEGTWDDAAKINEGSTKVKINGTYYYY